MARKSILPYLGLDEPLDREKVLNYLSRLNKKMRWQNDSLVLIPRETPTTRARFQQLLEVQSQEDVKALREELKTRRHRNL